MRLFGTHQVPADRVLVYHVDTDPLTLDPSQCEDYVGQILLQAMYEPLLTRNHKGRIMPGAAERYRVSPDRLTYTFFLRRNARWTNGERVTAYDFEFAFRRLVNPAVASPVGPLLEIVLNGEAILSGKIPPDRLGITALGANTLQIQLENPVNYLEAMLSSPNFAPVPRKLLADHTGPWESRITNGPFHLTEYVPRRWVSLRPNPEQARVAGGVGGLRFWIINDLYDPLVEYEAGRLHITCNTFFPFERLQQLSSYDDFKCLPSGILFYLQFNRQAMKCLDDVRIRQALAHSIDRVEIARRLHGGILPWHHFVSAGVSGSLFDEQTGKRKVAELPTGRLAEAAPLIAGSRIPGIRMLYADYYPNRQILMQVKEMWYRTLGVSLTLEPATFADHTRRMAAEEFETGLVLLGPSYCDPSSFLRYFLPDLEAGEAEALARLLVQAQEGKPAIRDSAFRKADALLSTALPGIPLASGQSIYLQKPEVRGYRMFADGSVSFRGLRFSSVNQAAASDKELC